MNVAPDHETMTSSPHRRGNLSESSFSSHLLTSQPMDNDSVTSSALFNYLPRSQIDRGDRCAPLLHDQSPPHQQIATVRPVGHQRQQNVSIWPSTSLSDEAFVNALLASTPVAGDLTIWGLSSYQASADGEAPSYIPPYLLAVLPLIIVRPLPPRSLFNSEEPTLDNMPLWSRNNAFAR